MSAKTRIALFVFSCAAFTALYVAALGGLQPMGQVQGWAAQYGDTINRLSVPALHITDAVTAVNFEFRGFDTLGEEFIMAASVLGAALLLRQHPDERSGPPKDKAPGRTISRSSDAVRVLTVGLVGPVTLFGIYIVVHGQLTPGGGFQGGVILASAPLLIYLAGEFRSLRRVAPRWMVEVAEAAGAGGYAVIGAVSMVAGLPFLANYLPRGQVGDVFSGGIVVLIDLTVGLEVAGGLILLLLVFLEETLTRRGDPI